MRPNRIFWAIAFCAWIALIAIVLYPVRNTGLKILLLICEGISCAALVALVKSNLVRVLVTLLVLGTVIVIALGPERPVDTNLLRESYTGKLQRFHNKRYVWGGENRRGVDCSGLVRAAWIEALLDYGIRRINPALVREAFLIWWRDSSAKHLGEGYGTRTFLVQEATSVRALDSHRLKPGDLAVVANGVHVMAYLGDNRWIEADPGGRRVIVLNVKDNNPWLDSRALVVRWATLRE
jgi:hypothetical protein